jgi:hypothetical protein
MVAGPFQTGSQPRAAHPSTWSRNSCWLPLILLLDGLVEFLWQVLVMARTSHAA